MSTENLIPLIVQLLLLSRRFSCFMNTLILKLVAFAIKQQFLNVNGGFLGWTLNKPLYCCLHHNVFSFVSDLFFRLIKKSIINKVEFHSTIIKIHDSSQFLFTTSHLILLILYGIMQFPLNLRGIFSTCELFKQKRFASTLGNSIYEILAESFAISAFLPR